jgi:hypothetical protein
MSLLEGHADRGCHQLRRGQAGADRRHQCWYGDPRRILVFVDGHESLTAAMALANPYDPEVTLERNFLALIPLRGIITDQHLWERDRIGRTVTLLARLVQDGWTTDGRAIAADRETACTSTRAP